MQVSAASRYAYSKQVEQVGTASKQAWQAGTASKCMYRTRRDHRHHRHHRQTSRCITVRHRGRHRRHVRQARTMSRRGMKALDGTAVRLGKQASSARTATRQAQQVVQIAGTEGRHCKRSTLRHHKHVWLAARHRRHSTAGRLLEAVERQEGALQAGIARKQ